ncbi:hypothetical protein [Tenacibaculum maritimum]|uniref:hypothetical protein n=1 Tax=Tenacibaculum maritimum TaxID=107401 RepID=UPI001E4BFA10|nr:hypothetical protein [Tenacibaculum maritimum]MCD9562080.1 hypothetical protein [Tenacibaculum maritimum]MCD9566045.1 hypothetical protein [Tenacibaculum maritimum]MCD9578468.1 hypothetical protein [Tenacibaculum maritimum]MCD9596323.1 hypothetical protein [Tenacibaculum maritimum]MCD9612485.1 hypothetical protein [Tenacibaculum maritimum]
MATYIIGLCHSSNKKKATKSKRINFNFENPEKDRIAQQISWSSLESSSSNFKSEILFQEIYALQIIEKFSKSKRSSNSYPSYELNIITKNGNRYNLLNHGDKTHLLSDMVKISKVLRVPIWNKIIS